MPNRMHHLVLFFLSAFIAVIVLVASSGRVSAQVRIGIPRPPRVEPVRNPAPVTGTTGTTQPTVGTTGGPTAAPTSSLSNERGPAPIPSSIIIDDGFTYFTLHNKKDYVGGKPIAKGWSLVSDLRMAGPAIPKRSGYKIVVEKAGQTLATVRCE